MEWEAGGRGHTHRHVLEADLRVLVRDAPHRDGDRGAAPVWGERRASTIHPTGGKV